MILKLVLAAVFWFAMIVLFSLLLAWAFDPPLSSILGYPLGFGIGIGAVWSINKILERGKS